MLRSGSDGDGERKGDRPYFQWLVVDKPQLGVEVEAFVAGGCVLAVRKGGKLLEHLLVFVVAQRGGIGRCRCLQTGQREAGVEAILTFAQTHVCEKSVLIRFTVLFVVQVLKACLPFRVGKIALHLTNMMLENVHYSDKEFWRKWWGRGEREKEKIRMRE